MAESQNEVVVVQHEPVEFRELIVDDSLQRESFEGGNSITVQENLKALGARKVESVFDPNLRLVEPQTYRRSGNRENGLVTAVRIAYTHHVPLCLSPDHLWTLIIQGLSTHIGNNAEKMRSQFVDFDGKQTIRIIRDGFAKGSQDNNWAGCFNEFSEKIESFIGKEQKAKLCPRFSTTNAHLGACHDLALMDAMKSYFRYHVMTRCGISKVKLEGTPEDWKKLEASLEAVREFGMPEWADAMAPILNNFTRAASNQPVDDGFWNKIYKNCEPHMSGHHPTIDGWVTHFFPFINGQPRGKPFKPLEEMLKPKPQPDEDNYRFYRRDADGPIPQTAVPAGITKTPFIWEYLGKEIPMTFYGGFVGAKMDDNDEYISPVIGWAVGEDVPEPPKQSSNRRRW